MCIKPYHRSRWPLEHQDAILFNFHIANSCHYIEKKNPNFKPCFVDQERSNLISTEAKHPFHFKVHLSCQILCLSTVKSFCWLSYAKCSNQILKEISFPQVWELEQQENKVRGVLCRFKSFFCILIACLFPQRETWSTLMIMRISCLKLEMRGTSW